jgi:hypothetical protein
MAYRIKNSQIRPHKWMVKEKRNSKQVNEIGNGGGERQTHEDG